MLYKIPASAVGAAALYKVTQSEHLPGNINKDYAQEGETYSDEHLAADNT
jgi:hypothetical protein